MASKQKTTWQDNYRGGGTGVLHQDFYCRALYG